MPELLLPLPIHPPAAQLACLVMADLVGSTRLAHGLRLEHYATLMTEFVQLLILSFEVRGGQVLQHQGDAVLALWPSSQTSQAVLAALEAHERVARLGLAAALGLRLELRAGVAAGPVVTGPVGGQPSAYGLPVNYARRLCDAAAPGETLVCDTAARHLGPAVVGVPRPLPSLRGFPAACQAYAARLPAALPPGRMKTG
ncbi:adenylate/guanylate cyclase domain-containing protein [Deinococcus budaensis]|uniref:Class 3 adenylate cyclase n=1 Tax=Deinococcus budaensis TaxID=1665626 RepID=A0A7W8GJ04_9DEIO|nr:adenylate/guanylate cyclase domain-containing protein [Deinococcus budaensis]MBB5236189.1 class 3 adenylate cyclase [Deinococcus budaensis]